MKRMMTIAGVLLLGFVMSCRKADSTADGPGDPGNGDGPSTREAVVNSEAAGETIDPLDECQSLLDKAVAQGASDPAGPLETLDQADGRLHDCMYTANQVYWLQMESEVREAREKLTKALQNKAR
jgi:hypothetical protein